MSRMPQSTQPSHVCTMCGTADAPTTRGSLLLEVALWCAFAAPGFLYTLWRQPARGRTCRTCGHVSMIPLGTPLASKVVGEARYWMYGTQPAIQPQTHPHQQELLPRSSGSAASHDAYRREPPAY